MRKRSGRCASTGFAPAPEVFLVGAPSAVARFPHAIAAHQEMADKARRRPRCTTLVHIYFKISVAIYFSGKQIKTLASKKCCFLDELVFEYY